MEETVTVRKRADERIRKSHIGKEYGAGDLPKRGGRESRQGRDL
jgi:hypothetical protein